MKSSQDNFIEIFNELCILLCAHTFNIFINNAVPFDMRYKLGWVFIGIAVFNIAVNLAFTIKESIVDIFNGIKNKFRTYRAEKIVSNRMKNRRILIEKAPKIFPYFEYEVNLYDSIDFSKEWLVHRKWLIQNKINFEDYDEHKRYKMIQEKFMLEQRVKFVNCSRGMKVVAERLAKE